VPSGTLHCNANAVTNTAPSGVTYAINGLAVGRHQWPDINPVWANDPASNFAKKDIGVLIDRGLRLC
jgi:uncharacterized protein DUF2511